MHNASRKMIVMKKIFYIGVLGFGLFEILNVYFIMPMPGSQQMNSIDLAYFLHIHAVLSDHCFQLIFEYLLRLDMILTEEINYYDWGSIN